MKPKSTKKKIKRLEKQGLKHLDNDRITRRIEQRILTLKNTE